MSFSSRITITTLFVLVLRIFYFRPSIVFLLPVGGVVWLFMKGKDPYGVFHSPLNKLPGEDPDSPPKTEWLNMGYWKDTAVFPEACEALALKLVRAAKYKAGAKVLDVGHGSGESLIFLLSHPTVPRPSSLTGITSLVAHHRRSQDRVTKLQRSQQHEPRTTVILYQGDAIYRPTSVDHPLDPSSAHFFEAVLALDCAYHFETRLLFLRQSFERLAPGGRIALADICFDPSALQSRRNRLIISFLRLMPKENVISTEQYVRDLEGIGYVDVTMEDVTADVFPSFLRFLRERGWGWSIFGHVLSWYAGAGARFIIVSGAKDDHTTRSQYLNMR